MSLGLQTITPPATEPVNAEFVKTHTHVDTNEEDNLLTMWIKSAREQAEEYQGRAYIEQTLELSLDCFPLANGGIVLPRSPVSSVSSIKYYGTDDTEYTLSDDVYQVDTASEPSRVALKYGQSWPLTTLRTVSGVKIRFVAGEGDAPSDVNSRVIDAILIYCAYRYENRTAEIEAPPQFYRLLDSGRVKWL